MEASLPIMVDIVPANRPRYLLIKMIFTIGNYTFLWIGGDA